MEQIRARLKNTSTFAEPIKLRKRKSKLYDNDGSPLQEGKIGLLEAQALHRSLEQLCCVSWAA